LRTQVYFSCRSYRRLRAPLVVSVAVLLAGCWTPPSASVRPQGKPRVIEGGIEVDQIAGSAKVEAVDHAARTLALSVRGVPPATYKIGRGVRNWDEVRVGDRVRATIKVVLTVYVARANASGSSNVGVLSRSPDARVLVVDPSYRLLKVQYTKGGTETFKIGLHTRMKGMEPGDSVAIRPVEVIGLRVRR
jgi:hypothetical protein